MAGLPPGAGQGRANRPGIPLVLPFGQRAGPRRQDLADRRLEDWRRNDVGMDRLRSGPELDLFRHRQSWPMEPGAASGRQQMDNDAVRAQSRYWRRQMGVA